MSLENCSLPRLGADLKDAVMKTPFSSPSLLLELRRLYLCPWLAAQAGRALPCCPHAGCSPTGWAGCVAASMACKPFGQGFPGGKYRREPSSSQSMGGSQGGASWGHAVQMGLDTAPGNGAGNGHRHKMAYAGIAQPWMWPQTYLPANCFEDTIICFLGGFFSHHYTMLILQEQE